MIYLKDFFKNYGVKRAYNVKQINYYRFRNNKETDIIVKELPTSEDFDLYTKKGIPGCKYCEVVEVINQGRDYLGDFIIGNRGWYDENSLYTNTDPNDILRRLL